MKPVFDFQIVRATGKQRAEELHIYVHTYNKTTRQILCVLISVVFGLLIGDTRHPLLAQTEIEFEFEFEFARVADFDFSFSKIARSVGQLVSQATAATTTSPEKQACCNYKRSWHRCARRCLC